MSKTSRPFDIEPATECLICGTSIAGGAYCLQCEPAGARLGDQAWIHHRWFSGPAIEAKKRRIMALEYVNKAIVGTVAAMLAVVVVGQVLSGSQEKFEASNGIKLPEHKIARNAMEPKRPLEAVTIS